MQCESKGLSTTAGSEYDKFADIKLFLINLPFGEFGIATGLDISRISDIMWIIAD